MELDWWGGGKIWGKQRRERGEREEVGGGPKYTRKGPI